MALWKSTDANTSAPKFIPAQFNVTANSNTVNALFAGTTSLINANVQIVGVDSAEMQVASNFLAAPAHAGWSIRTEGHGGRAGRVTYETIVAMSSMTGDAEDTFFPDYRINISGQPQSSSLARGSAVNLNVGATSIPAGLTLTYQWQQDGGNGVLTWANSTITGNASATLAISNNFTVAGNTFRVMISNTLAATVFSSNAVVSYT